MRTTTIADMKAFSGAHNLDRPGSQEQARNITQLIVHPGWDTTTKVNDIALVMLDQPLQFDEFTKPIRIATSKPNISCEGNPYNISMLLLCQS